MRKIIKLVGFIIMSMGLVGCLPISNNIDNNSSDNSNNSSDNNNNNNEGYISSLPFDITGTSNGGKSSKIQDAPILHAWDWKISHIIDELDAIKEAGYKAIQLSPMQPSKKGDPNGEWWNLYQPLGFTVAVDEQNPLGNKEELTNLCSLAKSKGIDIVMDVVTNHLAQGSKGQLFTHGENWSDYRSVSDFEPKIIADNLIHEYSRYGEVTSDNNQEVIVKGSLGGLPDLKTEDSYVQSRVISMLKEYIDCGVKGFRFDAAKHIETPSDGEYASNFWSNVINIVSSYGLEIYNDEPYIYGEILNTPGAGRSFDYYTSMMSVVDNTQGYNLMRAIENRNINEMVNVNYTVGNPSKAVLWAESHDTWTHPGEDKDTSGKSDDLIDLTYVTNAARKDAAVLYFPRPSDRKPGQEKQVLTGISLNYKSNLIKSANKFHNDFVGGSELILNIENQVEAIIRKTSNNEGIMLINPNFPTTASSYTIEGISDGTYTDLITNKEYIVKDGLIDNLNFTTGACILEKYPNVENNIRDNSSSPIISINPSSGTVKSEDKVVVNVTNSNESYVKYNDLGWVKFNNEFTLDITDDIPDGNITISVAARNNDGISSYSITLNKKTPIIYEHDINLINVPEDAHIYCWIWKNDEDGSWFRLTKGENGYRYLDLENSEENIIFVLFPQEYDSLNNDIWNNKLKQTNNLLTSTEEYDYLALFE